MKKTTALIAVLAIAPLFVAGCGGKKSTTSGSAPSVGGAAPTTAASKVGIAECDEYVEKYQKCLSGKVPAAAQAALKTGFDQTITQWRQTASTPEGKTGLAMACKAALDATKQAMTAYGCEW